MLTTEAGQLNAHSPSMVGQSQGEGGSALVLFALIGIAGALLISIVAAPPLGGVANMTAVGQTLPTALGHSDGIIRVPLSGGAPFTVSATNSGAIASLTAVPTTSPPGSRQGSDIGLKLFVCETT